MKEIIFAGSGGQGVLTSGLIISDIAASEGIHVTWVPSYGSAMRGGTANCTVKYSNDGYIYNPSPETPDLLLAPVFANASGFSVSSNGTKCFRL